MSTAFQPDAFQPDAFQIGKPTAAAPAPKINPFAGLIIFAQGAAMAVKSMIVAR